MRDRYPRETYTGVEFGSHKPRTSLVALQGSTAPDWETDNNIHFVSRTVADL